MTDQVDYLHVMSHCASCLVLPRAYPCVCMFEELAVLHGWVYVGCWPAYHY